MLLKLPCTPGSSKKPPPIVRQLWLNNVRALKPGFLKDHELTSKNETGYGLLTRSRTFHREWLISFPNDTPWPGPHCAV